MRVFEDWLYNRIFLTLSCIRKKKNQYFKTKVSSSLLGHSFMALQSINYEMVVVENTFNLAVN